MASLRAKAKLIKHAKRQTKLMSTGRTDSKTALKNIVGLAKGRKKFRNVSFVKDVRSSKK